MLGQIEAEAIALGDVLQLTTPLAQLEARWPEVAGYGFVLVAESLVRTEEGESRSEYGYQYLKSAKRGGAPGFRARELPDALRRSPCLRRAAAAK